MVQLHLFSFMSAVFVFRVALRHRPGLCAALADMALRPADGKAAVTREVLVPGTDHSESWASEEDTVTDTKDAATMQASSLSSPRERQTSLLANLSAMLDLGTPRRTSPPHAWSINAVEYSPVLSPAKPRMQWSNRTCYVGHAPGVHAAALSVSGARDEAADVHRTTGISPSEAREREKMAVLGADAGANAGRRDMLRVAFSMNAIISEVVHAKRELQQITSETKECIETNMHVTRLTAGQTMQSPELNELQRPSSTKSDWERQLVEVCSIHESLKQQIHAIEKDNTTLKAQNDELLTSNAAMNSQICTLQEELETLQSSDAQEELRMLRKFSRVPAKCAMCGWERSVRIPITSKSSRPVLSSTKRENPSTVNTSMYEDVTREFRLGLHVLDKVGSMRVASFTPTSVCKDTLQVGDHILSIDGQRVRDARHLRQLCDGAVGTILSIRYSRIPDEVMEVMLQRSVDGQGQPIFTHYVPCTPRAPPPAAGGGNSNGLDGRGMNVTDNATPALERELTRSLELLGQVQAELLQSKAAEAQTLASLKRAKNDLSDAVMERNVLQAKLNSTVVALSARGDVIGKLSAAEAAYGALRAQVDQDQLREDAKTREIDVLLGKNFELESQIHLLKSEAVGRSMREEELRRVGEELQASNDAVEQECGNSQVKAAMKDELGRMPRLENERTNMMRVMMMPEKAAFEGRLDDAHAEIQRLSADVKSSRQGNASLSCCISRVPSIVPEPQSTRPVFLPLPPSPGGGDDGSVPTSP